MDTDEKDVISTIYISLYDYTIYSVAFFGLFYTEI